MDKSKFIAQVLERIQASEGAGFRMDREKILDKYRREPGESGPLAIKVLSVLGGILATVAFGAFLGFLDIFDSNPAMLGLGSILLVGSMALQRIYDSLVLDALGISLYILGMLLIIFGLGEFRLHGNSIALLVLGLALITLLVSRNYLLCFISTLVLAADFLYLILENELPDMIHAYVAFFSLALAHCMLNEAKYLSAPPLISRIYGPLRAGLIFSLLFGLVPIGIVGMAQMDSDRIWISALAPLAIILYQVPSILKILGTANRDRTTAYILCVLALLPTLFAPALAGALMIVLLSFKINYRSGLVLGVLALVYFVIQYYYDLNLSLLIKSMLLLGSGLLFLLYYLFFTKRTKPHEKI